MSKKLKTEPNERQARLAQVRAEQAKAERQRTTIIVLIVTILVLGLAGATIAVVTRDSAKNADLEAEAHKPIAEVETFDNLTRNHVTGTVDYAQNPRTGGDDSAIGQVRGFYSKPIADESGVHSLEHGAVWITHDPDLPADQLGTLRAAAEKDNDLLVSPRDGLSGPVVASAWGIPLPVKSADDARLPVFLRAYVNGPQTSEPGASCSEGIGTPE